MPGALVSAAEAGVETNGLIVTYLTMQLRRLPRKADTRGQGLKHADPAG